MIREWWEKKVVTQAERNNLEKNTLEHIRAEMESTTVSFSRMLKTFAEERQGHKSIIKSYISNMASSRVIPEDVSGENSQQIASFLQRVESSLSTEVHSY